MAVVDATRSSVDPSCKRRSSSTRPAEKIHRRTSDEARNENVCGFLIKLHRRIDLLDLAAVHDDDAPAERHRLDLIVRHVDHRRAELAMQLCDLDARAEPQFRIEIRQRFVEQENGGLAHQRATERDALALAAGKLRGFTIQHLTQIEDVCGLAHARFRFSAGRAAQTEPERKILRDGHVRIERVILEHHRDVAIARRRRR